MLHRKLRQDLAAMQTASIGTDLLTSESSYLGEQDGQLYGIGRWHRMLAMLVDHSLCSYPRLVNQGGNVTALIPHKDAYLLAATSNSLWLVRGDPVADGGLQNVSRDVGVVGPRAWCRDHLDRYYFLSSHGLYTVSASGDGLQGIVGRCYS